MDLQLSGKLAFVTGASSGIGAATATILAEEGVDVVVSYQNDSEGATRTAEQATTLGRRAWLCRMDVTRPEDISRAAQQVREEVGGLDILVLCAGYNVVTPLAEITTGEWERVLAVNLSGAFYVLQAMEPLLRDGGSIVTVASVAAHTGAPHHMHYAAAKAGLVNLTKSAARALAPRVRVNCVSPGITLTPMGQNTVSSLPPDYARQKLLEQRYATPEEIARCIVFVASPVAGFMTGATVDINGGRVLR
jgi:3-oxoacyl-[acyl-carrier protein] reductase